MLKRFLVILVLAFSVPLSADGGESIAIKYKIDPSKKAIAQWERIFSKAKKLKKFGIDSLSDADKSALKEYCIAHAADSDNPTVPGM